ncbi:MAG: hypothetical protein AAF721_22555 [Myxococcota bacterium]
MRSMLVPALLACVGGLGMIAGGSEAPSAIETPLGLDPAACARCHVEAAAHWRGSLHAQAWNDPVFSAEYDERPAASCRGCHDPAGQEGRSHGIDCATCHVREGAIVVRQASAAAARAHPLTVDTTLDGVTECAGCHQFSFTDDGIHDPTEALQATVDEWRDSRAASEGLTCVACHLDGHALAGLGSPSLLARAVEVEVEPVRKGSGVVVEVSIAGGRIGHAFPTGDVFRQAVLEVRTSDGAAAEFSMQRWLARTADPDGLATHVRTVDDSRVPPPGRGVVHETLVLPETGAAEVTWSLELRRLPLGRARSRDLAPQQVVVPIAQGRAPVRE